MKEHINPALESLVKPIKSLKPDPRNARQHSEANIRSIMESFKVHGQQKPLVALSDGTIIAGNGTLEAVKRLGWTKIAVVEFDSKDKVKAMAFALNDNRSSELGEWERELLQIELDELKALEYNLGGMGFAEEGGDEEEVPEEVEEALRPVEKIHVLLSVSKDDWFALKEQLDTLDLAGVEIETTAN